MRTIVALLIALPLAAAAQYAPPPEAPTAPPPPAAQVAPPPPPSAGAPATTPSPPRRDSWYIGFGLGSGGAKYTDATGTYKLSDGMTDSTTVLVNFKVGATLTPTLLLGLDLAGFRTEGKFASGLFAGNKVSQQISSYDAMLTWFPMERGLFLRGGLGLSVFKLDIPGVGTDSVSGLNLDVGAGYAFWLLRTFNLTVNLDFSGQSYNSNKVGAPSKSSFAALWLGFDWY
jgi:hypothetical protein